VTDHHGLDVLHDIDDALVVIKGVRLGLGARFRVVSEDVASPLELRLHNLF